jgi:hypothetical protein
MDATQKRIALAGISGVLLLVGIYFALQFYWQRQQPVFNGPKLIPALRAYARERAARGQPLPPTVSLQDLVSGGYLAKSDVAALQGAEVTFYTSVDFTSPRAVLARAHMPDGTDLVVLADGSVQGATPGPSPNSKQ